jgi:hypothetical protein
VIEDQAVSSKAVDHGGQQDALQVAAVYRELRVLITSEAAGWFAIDELAEAVEEGRFPGGDADRGQLFFDTAAPAGHDQEAWLRHELRGERAGGDSRGCLRPRQGGQGRRRAGHCVSECALLATAST